MTSSDEYRKNAAGCLALAGKTQDLETKAEWLKLAEGWSQMAAAARHRPSAFEDK
jgi:hypothetical protein